MASFKKSPSLNAIKVRFSRVLINSVGNWCYKSNQVTGCLIDNQGYFEAVKQLFVVSPKLVSSLKPFFISNSFISNAKMKFAKTKQKLRNILRLNFYY